MASYAPLRVSYNSSTTQYAIPFDFMEKSHVKATLDGVPVTFSWVDDTQISITPDATKNGQLLEVYRDTSSATPLVDLGASYQITARNLEIDSDQAFKLAQENKYASSTALKRGVTTSSGGGYDAKGLPINNIGTPSKPFDAVTKQYLESDFRYEVDQDIDAVAAEVENINVTVAGLTSGLNTTNGNLSALTDEVDSLTTAVANNKGEKGDDGEPGPVGPYYDLDVAVEVEDEGGVITTWPEVWAGSQETVHLPTPNAGLYLLRGLFEGSIPVSGTVHLPFDVDATTDEFNLARIGGSVYVEGSTLIAANWYKDYGFKLAAPGVSSSEPATYSRTFTTTVDPYDIAENGFIALRGGTSYKVSGGGLKPSSSSTRFLAYGQLPTGDVIKSSIVMGHGEIFSDHSSPAIGNANGYYYAKRQGAEITVYYWNGTSDIIVVTDVMVDASAGAVFDFIYTVSTDTLQVVYRGDTILTDVGTNLSGDVYLGIYMSWGNTNAAFTTSWTGEGFVESSSTGGSAVITNIYKRSQELSINATTTVTKTLVSGSSGAEDTDPTNPEPGVFNYAFDVTADPYVGTGLTTLVGTGGYSVISGLRPKTASKMHLAFDTVTVADELEASITVVNGINSDDVLSPALWRADGTGYFMERDGSSLYLKSYSGGVYTTLGTYSGGPVTVTASDVLTVRCVRSTSAISFLYNGVPIFSAAGGSLTGDLYLGMFLELGNTAASYVSDFTVSGYLEDVVTPPPPPAPSITVASAEGISTTEIRVTFRSISAGQYWLQKRLTSGTQWADYAQVTLAADTESITVSGGNSVFTGYTFRIFGPNGEASAEFSATTLAASGGGGGDVPAYNGGETTMTTGTSAPYGVIVPEQEVQTGVPNSRTGPEPVWELKMTAESLTIGQNAGGSGTDLFNNWAADTTVSGTEFLQGSKGYRAFLDFSEAYTVTGGNPGNGNHQGGSSWGGQKSFPSNVYAYRGHKLHVQFSIKIPSSQPIVNGGHVKIFRVGGVRTTGTGNGMGFATILMEDDNSPQPRRLTWDNEIHSFARQARGESVYGIHDDLNAYFQKGVWNTVEMAIYIEPDGTRGVVKVWLYDQTTKRAVRVYTSINTQHVLMYKESYITQMVWLNIWNIFGSGWSDQDVVIYGDRFIAHSNVDDLVEFDDLGEPVIGFID